ncbi:MAG: cysteine desulfurase [Methanobrevibacter sp.]|jgi:cysteine desulfurase/selenocysteine lyase|nr:cysteine desulfurase [Candidatus Methanovirga basalitermitum]
MREFEEIRKDFPMLKEFTYLDSASTSLTPIPVVEAMNDYYYNYNSNTGRGNYRIAIKSTAKLEDAREKIAKFINGNHDEIVFTKNTTEAINMVANGLRFEKGDNVIVSSIEHHSNLVPWLNLNDVKTKIAKINNDYTVNPEDVFDLIDESTKLIAISHISNVFGSMQDVEEISKIAKENSVLFLVDAAQSVGYTPINVKKLNPDFMAFPGHKGLLGPVGTGFLYLKKEIADDLMIKNLGGGTVTNIEGDEFRLEDIPYKFESGTHNISGIIGLSKAIDYINNIKIENIRKYCNKLTNELYEKIHSIKKVEVYGNLNNIHHTVSFNVRGLNPYDVSKILDETSNICIRSGFHCSIPSLQSIGINSTIRASIHCYNNFKDLEKLYDGLKLISQLS